MTFASPDANTVQAQTFQSPHGFYPQKNRAPIVFHSPQPRSPISLPRKPPPHVQLPRARAADEDIKGELPLPPRNEYIKTKGITLRGVKAYAEQHSLKFRKRDTWLDLVRFTQSKAEEDNEHLPIVILAPQNSIWCQKLEPNQHGYVSTASPSFTKLLEMPAFHLMVRLEPGGNTFEKARYFGVYTARVQRPLLPHEWSQLSLQERTSVLQLHQGLDPEASQDVIKKSYEMGERQLLLIVLENTHFDRKFYDETMAIDVNLVHPVARPRCLVKPPVDWKKMHEEWMD